MEHLWKTVLWRQFGATIDMLENALLACPDAYWHGQLWRDHSERPLPPVSGEFWYVTYHVLFWLDLYLGGSVTGFAPPAPFTLDELDPEGKFPERPYAREELHTYLLYLHEKCQNTIIGLSDERAQQQVSFPWLEGKPMSFLELLLYSMRHVQEHAAQLNLFLGQNAIDGSSDWVPWVDAEKGSA